MLPNDQRHNPGADNRRLNQNEAAIQPYEDGTIDLGRIEARKKASGVKKMGEIIDKHPHRALSIVRNWLHLEN